MTQLFTNNAASKLATSIADDATTITLLAGDGAMFPNPQAGDDFLLTLFQRVGTSEQNHEIVRVTARNGDVLTVVRAQEGTTARAFANGDFAELRLTAGAILPMRNGAVSGPLNEAAPATLASASAVAIGAAKANTIIITGTTAITGFDAIAAGAVRRTTFTGALTLTHHATKLHLIGDANIVTAAGDYAEWLSNGAGNWTMIAYARATGDSIGTVSLARGGTGATTAAAARTNLGLGVVENKTSATIRGELTYDNVTSALTYSPPNRATFAVANISSVRAETNDLRSITNPATGLNYGAGVRFRFANANDINDAQGYADVIDLSTFPDAAGGGYNALYLNKNSQVIQHKWAQADATVWTVKTLAYTDSSITGTATNVTGVVALANGGTGANNATTARANLGIGNVENKSSATIRGEITKANVETALNYTPLVMGGAYGQLSNIVRIGWLTGSRLGLAVDVTDFGSTWPININGSASALNGQAASYYLALANTTGVLALSKGGTGATDAAGARNAIGLGSVNNTSDVNKPISTATQSALDGKASLSGAAFTGPVRGAVAAIAALNIDFGVANHYTKSVSAVSAFTFSNIPAGDVMVTLEMKFLSGGAASFPSSVIWPEDSAPVFLVGKTYLIVLTTSNQGGTVRAVASAPYSG